MNSQFSIAKNWAIGMGALLLAAFAGPSAHAASAPANDPAHTTAAVSNAPSYSAQSVFAFPANKQEGRDPFYPKSEYPFLHAKPATSTTPAPVVPQSVDLKLSGISGTRDHPLAIINGKTFEQGEEGEVRVGPARINIRVVKIEADAVTVQIGTQQQVLHLRRL